MNKQAYEQGCVAALEKYALKTGPVHPAVYATLAAAAGGIPLLTGALAGATAPSGESVRNAVRTGGGSALGGVLGGAAGLVAGGLLGHRIHPLGALLAAPAGVVGMGLGQIGGAVVGHPSRKAE